MLVWSTSLHDRGVATRLRNAAPGTIKARRICDRDISWELQKLQKLFSLDSPLSEKRQKWDPRKKGYVRFLQIHFWKSASPFLTQPISERYPIRSPFGVGPFSSMSFLSRVQFSLVVSLTATAGHGLFIISPLPSFWTGFCQFFLVSVCVCVSVCLCVCKGS